MKSWQECTLKFCSYTSLCVHLYWDFAVVIREFMHRETCWVCALKERSLIEWEMLKRMSSFDTLSASIRAFNEFLWDFSYDAVRSFVGWIFLLFCHGHTMGTISEFTYHKVYSLYCPIVCPLGSIYSRTFTYSSISGNTVSVSHNFLVHGKSTLTHKHPNKWNGERARGRKSSYGSQLVAWNVYLSIKWWKLLDIKRNIGLSPPTEHVRVVALSAFSFVISIFRCATIQLRSCAECAVRISSAFYVIVNMPAFSCARYHNPSSGFNVCMILESVSEGFMHFQSATPLNGEIHRQTCNPISCDNVAMCWSLE